MLRVAVIVPMYQEADNVVPLLGRLATVRELHGLDLTVLPASEPCSNSTWSTVHGCWS